MFSGKREGVFVMLMKHCLFLISVDGFLFH